MFSRLTQILSLLMMVAIFTGCGSSRDDFVFAGQVVSPAPILASGEILISQDLATEQTVVPADISSFRITVLDSAGEPVFGPEDFEKAEEVTFSVSIAGVFLRIEYLSNGQVVALHERTVRVKAGETTEVVNPVFIPASGGLVSIAIAPPSMNLLIGETANPTVLASFIGGGSGDVTAFANLGVLDTNVAVIDGAATVTGLNPGSTALQANLFLQSAISPIAVGTSRFSDFKLVSSTDIVNLLPELEADLGFSLIGPDGVGSDVSGQVSLVLEDTGVASILPAGSVLGVTPGSTQLMAVHVESGASTTLNVVVHDPETLPSFVLDDGGLHTFDTGTGALDGVPHPAWNGSQMVVGNFELSNGTFVSVIGPKKFDLVILGDGLFEGMLSARGGSLKYFPSPYMNFAFLADLLEIEDLEDLEDLDFEPLADALFNIVASLLTSGNVTDGGPGGGRGGKGGISTGIAAFAGQPAAGALTNAQLSAGGGASVDGSGGGGGHRSTGSEGRGPTPGAGGSSYLDFFGFLGGAGGGGATSILDIILVEEIDDDDFIFVDIEGVVTNLLDMLLSGADYNAGGGGGGAVRISCIGDLEFRVPAYVPFQVEFFVDALGIEVNVEDVVAQFPFIDAGGGDGVKVNSLIVLLLQAFIGNPDVSIPFGGGGSGGAIVIDAPGIDIEPASVAFGLRTLGGSSLGILGKDLFTEEDLEFAPILPGGRGSAGVVLINGVLQPEADPDAELMISALLEAILGII